MAQGYVRISELPQVVPVFPVGGAVLLPRGQLPLNVFEPRYLNMVDDAMAGDRIIGMIQPMGGPDQLPALARVGCLGRITSFAETSDGRYLITLTGICRFRVGAELPAQTPYRQVRASFVEFAPDLETPESGAAHLDRGVFRDALAAYLEHRGLGVDWDAVDAAPEEALVNSLTMALPFEPPEKQALIEAPTVSDRARALVALMRIDAAGADEDEGPGLQ